MRLILSIMGEGLPITTDRSYWLCSDLNMRSEHIRHGSHADIDLARGRSKCCPAHAERT